MSNKHFKLQKKFQLLKITPNCTNFFRFFTLFQVELRFFTQILACTFGREVKLRPMWGLNKKHWFCSIFRQFYVWKINFTKFSINNFYTEINFIVVHTFLITPKKIITSAQILHFQSWLHFGVISIREASLLTKHFFYNKKYLANCWKGKGF